MRRRSSNTADPLPRAELARRRATAGFICGLVGFLLALSAGFFVTGTIPGRTSGEAMLLLVFVAFPLAFIGLGLSLWGWRRAGVSGFVYAGVVLALVVLVSTVLVLALVYYGWSRCAPNCI